MIERIVCLVFGYLCGCLLTAELVARELAHRSVFELGDGNPGMANIGHELGTRAALMCLAGDILKTLLPVLLTGSAFRALGWQVSTAWSGLGATLGHVYPFWHSLRGGKGVTTIASTIVLMSPILGAVTGVVGVATIILSGYLSVGAVVAMAFYTVVTLFIMPWECALVTLAFTLMQLVTHASKLQGIRTGTTKRASLSTKFWKRFGRK